MQVIRIYKFSKASNKFTANLKSVPKPQITQRQKLMRLGRISTNLRMGIVGMANVGKSTTFNLLSNQSVPAENFPFCTIDPNYAMVDIKDERFQYLCNAFEPENKIGPYLSVTDIAGLVKGASEGYGLGNEFLGHIQQVDGLFQVVRAFDKESILHTEGVMDPLRDLEIISKELIAKDQQIINKRVEDVGRKVKQFERGKNDSAEARDLSSQYSVMVKCQELLKNNKLTRFYDWSDQECLALNKLQLLTAKPCVYLINLSDEDYQRFIDSKTNKYQQRIRDWVNENAPESSILYYSAEFEKRNIDQQQSQIRSIINEGQNLLNLIRFFTVGTDEVRSWTVKEGCKAPQAASVIHTDFERGFISAEVLAYDKFKELGQDGPQKFQKSMRKEGKDYTVIDGDIIHFKCKIVK